jgi:hypothetical protein
VIIGLRIQMAQVLRMIWTQTMLQQLKMPSSNFKLPLQLRNQKKWNRMKNMPLNKWKQTFQVQKHKLAQVSSFNSQLLVVKLSKYSIQLKSRKLVSSQRKKQDAHLIQIHQLKMKWTLYKSKIILQMKIRNNK